MMSSRRLTPCRPATLLKVEQTAPLQVHNASGQLLSPAQVSPPVYETPNRCCVNSILPNKLSQVIKTNAAKRHSGSSIKCGSFYDFITSTDAEERRHLGEKKPPKASQPFKQTTNLGAILASSVLHFNNPECLINLSSLTRKAL